LENSKNTDIGAATLSGGLAGQFTKEEGIFSYYEICEKIRIDNWNKKWDEQQKCVYAFKGDQWVGFDDRHSVSVKVKWAIDNELGGTMFWTLDFDDYNGMYCLEGSFPLARSIKKTFERLTGQTDPTVPMSLTSLTSPTTTKSSLYRPGKNNYYNHHNNNKYPVVVDKKPQFIGFIKNNPTTTSTTITTTTTTKKYGLSIDINDELNIIENGQNNILNSLNNETPTLTSTSKSNIPLIGLKKSINNQNSTTNHNQSIINQNETTVNKTTLTIIPKSDRTIKNSATSFIIYDKNSHFILFFHFMAIISTL
jgi:hypothetical protein